MELSTWAFSKARKMTCQDCLELFEEATVDRKPDCIKCGWKPVIDENVEFIDIVSRYALFLNNGNGALNPQAITLLSQFEDLDLNIFLKKLIIYYSNGLRVEQEGR